MNKIKKILLILNIILTAFLGFIIFQLSNLMYRYKRTRMWIEQNEFNNQLYIDLQEIIPFAWMIWGALIVIAILLFIFEFRKKITY
ncbi:MAG: hypothetical protein K0S76_2185 [Herbinix sp.]|jgi:hypothetical protein|nr:hypothetical protein [Herbinix sp.]